jgi:hypothetical protein
VRISDAAFGYAGHVNNSSRVHDLIPVGYCLLTASKCQVIYLVQQSEIHRLNAWRLQRQGYQPIRRSEVLSVMMATT